MSVTVKFFASLREQLGYAEKSIEINEPCSISQVWQATCEMTRPENTLMAINMEYVNADALVRDGDEVAFFPPVTGG